MIHSIELRNVRVFRDQGTFFHLPMLCVLCGTNSSGKSSILKSLLLLRQSQGILETAKRRQGFLRFVGTQTDLGEYSTFVSDRDISKDISISLRVPSQLSSKDAMFLQSLQRDSRQDSLTQQVKHSFEPRNFFVDAKLVFTAIRAGGSSSEEIRSAEEPAAFGRAVAAVQGLLKRADYNLTDGEEIFLSWSVALSEQGKDTDMEPKHLFRMPANYFKEVGGLRLMEPDYTLDQQSVQFSVLLDGLLPSRLIGRMQRSKKEKAEMKDKKEDRWSIYPLPPHISDAIDNLKLALDRIHYIAPLRAPAKRFYITNYDALPNLDPAGEFLPYLLAREQEPEVVHMRPKEEVAVKEGLYPALDSWMHYLRTGETREDHALPCHEVRVSSLKGVLVELEMPTPGSNDSYSLADSGFGYSQVLPIFVRGLLAERESTLVVEQPELHLNPALQVRLAEFFVGLALAGKQVILETHSEHIVNSIRVLIAEQSAPSISDRSRIYFLECKVPCPVLHELTIQPNGTVQEWPHEFFGEAATLAARLLRAQKKHHLQSQHIEEE